MDVGCWTEFHWKSLLTPDSLRPTVRGPLGGDAADPVLAGESRRKPLVGQSLRPLSGLGRSGRHVLQPSGELARCAGSSLDRCPRCSGRAGNPAGSQNPLRHMTPLVAAMLPWVPRAFGVWQDFAKFQRSPSERGGPEIEDTNLRIHRPNRWCAAEGVSY